MISNPDVVVCIITKQYQKAFSESGFKSEDLFNESIGILSLKKHYLTSEKKPYVIKGGIPDTAYTECLLKDEKIFNYNQIKYELYNY